MGGGARARNSWDAREIQRSSGARQPWRQMIARLLCPPFASLFLASLPLGFANHHRLAGRMLAGTRSVMSVLS